jgi:predicted enzyme related to lactoylglutathione lyase
MTPHRPLRRFAAALAGTLALLSLLAACTGTAYNLPPVSSESDGQRRPGKFIWHDLISDDPAGSERFYSELLGWEFRSLALVGAKYWVIYHRGEPIGGMVDQRPLPAERDISQWVSVLSSADIDASVQAVADGGGAVLRQPVSLGDRGRIAVFTDPQGALFAALETTGGDPLDRGSLPPEGGFLWHELWTSQPGDAAAFYAGLSGLDAQALDDLESPAEIPVGYHLLSDGSHPRGGIRALPVAGAPPLWVPYARVLDLPSLESLLASVPALGGEVLVSAVERPAGGYMALIAGPSGAPIALQTWPEEAAAPGAGLVMGERQ